MSMETIDTKHTTTEPISAKLNRALDSATPSRYSRSINVNGIIITGAGHDTTGLLDLLTTVHPGRMFVLEIGSNGAGLAVGGGARCSVVSKGHSLCSEVIEISASTSDLPAVPSIIKANLLSGRPVDLFLLDRVASETCFELFYCWSNRVLFDSTEFSGCTTFLRRVAQTGLAIVDTQWLELAAWRNQLRILFEQELIQAQLPTLKRVIVRSTVNGCSCCYLGSFLISGWLIQALKGVVGGGKARFFQIDTPYTTSTIDLLVEHNINPGRSMVNELVLEFSEDTQPLTLRRENQHLITTWGTEYRTELPWTESSLLYELRSYFLAGSGVVDYPIALEKAFELMGQQCGQRD